MKLYLHYNFILFISFFFFTILYLMNKGIIKLNSVNKYIKNNFYFLNLKKLNDKYEFNIYYLEEYLIYIYLKNTNKKSWDEDIILRIYSIDEDTYQDVSIGGSNNNEKEMEIYIDIKLDYIRENINYNIPKKIIQINKNNLTHEETYNFYYFLNKNNFYSYEHFTIEKIKESLIYQYQDYIQIIEKINDIQVRLNIYILLYLNLNGGIYISEYVENLKSIDDLNIDTNTCLIKDNFLFLLFTKNNFIDPKVIIDDIENRRTIDFSVYLKEFEEIKNHSFVIKYYKNKEEFLFYTNHYIIEEYTFKIFSKKNYQYNIESLKNDYYSLTLINEDNKDNKEIENDLVIHIFYEKEKIIFNEYMIKYKLNNNYIFKIHNK